MAARFHQLLFVATITSVLALSASPATAANPSKLVQTLCSMNDNKDYNEHCTSFLNTPLGNAATSYAQLLDTIMTVAGQLASDASTHISTILEKPSSLSQSQLEALNVCDKKFKDLSKEFVIVNSLDPERKLSSMYDMKEGIKPILDCNNALAKARMEAPKIRAAIMGVTLLSAMAHNAVSLQKGQETGNPNREF